MHTRRQFLKYAGATAAITRNLLAQATKSISTPILNIAYEESGPAQGFPVILLHGFPDDAHAFDDVAPPLAKAGYRVLVPYLRGYGATRFIDPKGFKGAEQAAIGQDVVDFADALSLPRFAVSGYDWGGRAAQVATALHPDRVRAGVYCSGYSIQNTVDTSSPTALMGAPAQLKELWYQWYFNNERGREGLAANRREICKFLWHTWSPDWKFSDETYNRTALSFENPDFVDLVIHSYRHRVGNAPGETRFLEIEKTLAKRPKITVPSIVLYGASDPLARGGVNTAQVRTMFPKMVDLQVYNGVGHFLPREKPEAISSAMLKLLAQAQ